MDKGFERNGPPSTFFLPSFYRLLAVDKPAVPGTITHEATLHELYTEETNDVERQEECGPTNGLACPSSVNEVSLKCEHGLFHFSLALKQSWFDGTTILVASAALFARMMLTLEGQHG